MGRRSLGAKVVDGVLLYESPSGLERVVGCPRNWYYRYVLRIPDPPGKNAKKGTGYHGEIEHYQKTGEDVLGTAARRLKPWILQGSDLLIEHPIKGGLQYAPDLPAVGYIDLAHGRQTKIDSQGDEQHDDPPGTPEVLDWKFTGNPQYAKTGPQLAATIQMISYGAWAIRHFNGPEFVRLSHCTSGIGKRFAQKATILVPSAKIVERWNKTIVPAVALAKHTATIADVDLVEARLDRCSAFGGCTYAQRCKARQQQSLKQLFGETGMSNILDDLDKAEGAPEVSLNLAGDIAALEAALEAAVIVPPHFAEAVAHIYAVGKGTPPLGGDAAAAWAKVKGWDKSDGFAGAGKIGGIIKSPVSDPAVIVRLAGELGFVPSVGAPAPAPQAAKPPPPAGALPPDAPASDPAKATTGAVDVTTPAAPPPVVEPKAKPSKDPAVFPFKGVKIAELRERLRDALISNDAIHSEASTMHHTGECTTPAATTPAGIVLYVDAAPDAPSIQLDLAVGKIAKLVADRYGAVDIRCGGDDTPLSYGKWKGVLAAAIREVVSKGSTITPGVYTLSARGSEIGEVAAEAMRPLCATYVRGV